MTRGHYGRVSKQRYWKRADLVRRGKASYWMPYKSIEEAAACLRIGA